MTETVDWSYFTKHGGDVPGGSKDWFVVGEALKDECPICKGSLWFQYSEDTLRGTVTVDRAIHGAMTQICLKCGWNDPLCPRPERRMWKKVRFA